MPTTKVIKPKPVAATRSTLEKTKPVQVRAVSGVQSELQVPGPGRTRASSCPRSPRPDRSERAAAKTCCERRTRSSSTAPRTTATWPRTNPDHRKTTGPGKHVAVNPKHRDVSACPGQREQRGGRTETGTGTGTGRAGHSHKAFTVIPPNPKKRREIQRKAEAELAALEELRLSRAMAYVSISPSSVGGCMSLEEVRLKQQQEMMQAKKKQKPVKTQVVERTPVLRS